MYEIYHRVLNNSSSQGKVFTYKEESKQNIQSRLVFRKRRTGEENLYEQSIKSHVEPRSINIPKESFPKNHSLGILFIIQSQMFLAMESKYILKHFVRLIK